MADLTSLTKEELLAQNRQLQALVEQQSQLIVLLQQQIEALKAEIALLKGGGKPRLPAPDWAKANTKPPVAQAEVSPRKKRANSFVRLREEPTEKVVHTCAECPDCGRALSGGSLRSRRQIIDLPAISVKIVEHLFQERYCGVCRKRCFPSPDLSETAVGQSRFGQNIHALVAYLRFVGRLPIRSIASLLSALCHLKVSVGEVVGMLASVSALGQSAYDGLKESLRKSAYVHGDETGWRESGQNGYLWSFATPDACYFLYPKTRAGHVVTDVLGEDYPGIVVSDFYAAYNAHFGLHQRCWVHFLRDIHKLTEQFPTEGVRQWCEKVRKVYDRAKAFSSPCRKERVVQRFAFQRALSALATPYAGTNLPQGTLCKRILTFEGELFTFVEYPDVPSENNFAERIIRPRVIARKVSGGTKSAEGSKTMVVLSSLFATWKLRGEEALEACRDMMRQALNKSLPQSDSILIPQP